MNEHLDVGNDHMHLLSECMWLFKNRVLLHDAIGVKKKSS